MSYLRYSNDKRRLSADYFPVNSVQYSEDVYEKELDDICRLQDSPWTSQDDFCFQEGSIDLEQKVRATLEELSTNLNEKDELTSLISGLSQISLAPIWRLNCIIDFVSFCKRKVQKKSLNDNEDDLKYSANWFLLSIPRILCGYIIGPATSLVMFPVKLIGTWVMKANDQLQDRLEHDIPYLMYPLTGLKFMSEKLQFHCQESLLWLIEKLSILEKYVPFNLHVKGIIEHLKDLTYPPSQLGLHPITVGEVKHVIKEQKTVLVLQLKDNKYQVAAGTVERLLQQLCLEEGYEEEFIKCFLHCHHLFMSSLSLLSYLFKKYLKELRKTLNSKKRKNSEKNLERITVVLMFWLNLRYQDFNHDAQMFGLLSDFLHQMKAQHQVAIKRIWSEKMIKAVRTATRRLSQDLTKGQYLIERCHSNPDYHSSEFNMISFVFTLLRRTPRTPAVYPFSYHSILLDMDYETIARILCCKDLELFKQLTIYHFLIYHTSRDAERQNDDSNTIHILIERSNMIRNWVACELCTILDLNERYLLIRRFIHIAKFCGEMNSFHTAMMITSGLLSNPVQSLKRSWKLLSNNEKNSFHSLERLLDVSGNMKFYRAALTGAKSPGTPFLPLLLKDVTFLLEGSPTFIRERSSSRSVNISDDLVNFTKFRDMIETIEQTMRITRGKYKWKKGMDPLFDTIEGRINDWYSLGGKTEKSLLEWSKMCED